ncbi:sulfotransferase [uncultured Paracoccus sp.]|uniref:sulfotransferase family protein n=1 Tax=uncultured Paracoccus sp. TaxID=189685 RepID=UPI0025FDA50C|nr:sulfotransferase [uncultured Paracoccus sp.]
MNLVDMDSWDAQGRPRKPAIVGIGAQKAGTTWLSQILSQHPRIWVPPFKEAQFFNARYIPQHMQWLPWHFRRAKLNIRKRYDARGQETPHELGKYLDRITREPMFTNHWYKQLFAPAPESALPMDVTPEYSTLPEEGVEFVAKFLHRSKFIYILRHPVDRAISQLKMNLTRGRRKPRSIAEWMEEIGDPVLLDRGDYETYIPRWRRHFDEKRLLILPFGMIRRDPLGFMRRIEAFTGLEPHDYTGLGTQVFAGPKGMAVPDEVRAALRARLESQFAFLERSFPPGFVDQMR